MVWDLVRFIVEEICNIVWVYVWIGELSVKFFFVLKIEILRWDLKEVEESFFIVIFWFYFVNVVNIKFLFRVIKYEILRRGFYCFIYR